MRATITTFVVAALAAVLLGTSPAVATPVLRASHSEAESLEPRFVAVHEAADLDAEARAQRLPSEASQMLGLKSVLLKASKNGLADGGHSGTNWAYSAVTHKATTAARGRRGKCEAKLHGTNNQRTHMDNIRATFGAPLNGGFQDQQLQGIQTNSGSGESFFAGTDVFIKTLPLVEVNKYLALLADIETRFQDGADRTLLVPIFWIIKMSCEGVFMMSKATTVYFVVMPNIDRRFVPVVALENIDDAHKKIHRFDLKGSSARRYESDATKMQKDKNFLLGDFHTYEIRTMLGGGNLNTRKHALAGLVKDVKLLHANNIVDYSLLLSFKRVDGTANTNAHAATMAGPYSNMRAPVFRLKDPSSNVEYVAFANIIDYLVVYDNSRKRLTDRQMRWYKGSQSARETLAYALRFLVNMDMYLPKVVPGIVARDHTAVPAIATSLGQYYANPGSNNDGNAAAQGKANRIAEYAQFRAYLTIARDDGVATNGDYTALLTDPIPNDANI